MSTHSACGAVFRYIVSRAFENTRSDYSEHAVNARGRHCEHLDLYTGISLFTCGTME